MRLWFRGASRIAPGIAERHAAALFLTPRGRRGRAAPVPAVKEQRAVHPAPFAIAADGVRLAAWSVGSGPTVLLLHGWSGSASDMAPIAASLVDAGYRAVLVDMPAHGRSPGRRTSLVEWLRVLPAVAAGAGPLAAVVGHSLGGTAVTLALAEGRLRAPAAALIAPALGPIHFVERFARAIGLPPEREHGLMRRIGAIVGRSIETIDARGAAAALALPALVLHDPADREVPWEHGEALAAAWTGSTLRAIPGAGHRRILKDASARAAVVELVRGAGIR